MEELKIGKLFIELNYWDCWKASFTIFWDHCLLLILCNVMASHVMKIHSIYLFQSGTIMVIHVYDNLRRNEGIMTSLIYQDITSAQFLFFPIKLYISNFVLAKLLTEYSFLKSFLGVDSYILVIKYINAFYAIGITFFT